MERIFSILTRETIKKHVASLLVVVLMLSQSMVAGAEVGSFTGESKRIKSTRGCQHNCWTDEGCQELLWQIMNTDPEAYEEIREEMLAYGWDDSGYGPGFATDSDADEIENTEPEKATPSDADEKTDGKATPSDADQQKPEKATPSDAYEKASDSDADEKINSKYRITDDGRLKLRACEHEHDEECGYYAWKTTYEYEDEEVKVKAVVVSENEEALPDGSELVVEKITEPEDIEYIARKITEETGRSYDCSQAYDIRFEFGGDEVEPEDATVKVQLKYKEAVPVNEPGEVQAGEEAGNDIRVLHLTHDNQIEDVTGDISKNMAGDLKSATFETESFSIFVLTQVLPNGTFFQYEDEEKMITASVSNAAEIPSDAKLVVDVIGEEDERYADAAQRLAAEEGYGTGGSFILYDFYFLDTYEEQIEVGSDAEISLDIQYKQVPQQLQPQDSGFSARTVGNEINGAESNIIITQLSEDGTLNKRDVSGQDENTGVRMTFLSRGMGLLAVTRGYVSESLHYGDIFSEGGDYTLDFILHNFNLFASDDADVGHTVGPVAVGKNFMAAGLAGVSHGGRQYYHKTHSYAGVSGQSPWGLLYPDGSMAQAGKYFIFSQDATLKQVSGAVTQAKGEPLYIDFDQAFSEIAKEIDAYATYDFQDRYVIRAEDTVPRSYPIETGRIYIFEDDLFDRNGKISSLNVSSGDDTNAIVIIRDFNNHVVESIAESKLTNQASKHTEWGDGPSVVHMLPDVLNIQGGSYTANIVAPKATYRSGAGERTGCLVVKNILMNGSTRTESHMWPMPEKILLNGSFGVRMTKQVDGQIPGEDWKGKFTFVLKDFETGTEISRATNDANGLILFDPIPYDETGVYRYLVEEEAGSEPDMRYDTKQYYVEVTVEEDSNAPSLIQNKPVISAEGWLWDSVNETKVGDATDLLSEQYIQQPTMMFHNTTSTSVTFGMKLLKQVDGQVPGEDWNGKFTFLLKDFTTGTEISRAVNNTVGLIEFNQIVYNEVGTYEYLVEEQAGTEAGIQYDLRQYYIKVTVTNNPNAAEGQSKLLVAAEGWLWDPVAGAVVGNSVDMSTEAYLVQPTIIFNNTTNINVVLPETGSAGTRKFTYTGFWLFMMGLMGMMYSGQERKRKVRN